MKKVNHHITKVFLDNKIADKIKMTDEGYQYFPKNSKEGGEIIMDENIKDALHNKILKTMLLILYNEAFPIELGFCNYEYINGRKERSKKLFQNDPVFHTKVRNATLIMLDELSTK